VDRSFAAGVFLIPDFLVEKDLLVE